MPWSPGDADKHKKDLSAADKKKWAKIANEVLDACETSGGKDCDAHAIRVANSKTGGGPQNG